MTFKELQGELVYLTAHIDTYLREVNPEFKIPMANRLAKIIKVFDWETEEGKLLLEVRKKSDKWNKKYSPKEYRFVLKIYYPDLIIKKKPGITVEEVLPRFYPGTKKKLFDVVPKWMKEDINKKGKEVFFVKENTDKDSK